MVRDAVLSMFNNIDLFEYYTNSKIVFANTAHHIIEIKDDWSKRFDLSNLFPCSNNTHNKIHALYKNNKTGTQKLLLDILTRHKE